MRKIIISVVSLFLAGCAIHVPQTRTEFTSAVARGEGPTEVRRVNSSKSLDDIVRILKAKSNECLAKTITRSGYMMAPSSSTYNPSVRRVSNVRAEFTLQVMHSPRGTAKVPEGGLYILAADIVQESNNSSQLTFYTPTFAYDQITPALINWSQGKAASCPDLK